MDTDESDVDYVSEEVLRCDKPKRKKTRPSTDRSLKCKTCGKKFSDHNDRKKHELIHLPGFPYPCNICAYRGKTKQYLVRHVKKVHGERNIKCDYCPAVFVYQCKKDEHMRVHTGEKPYKCRYCPKTFRVPYTLKCHMLTHTDEKPFKCNFCEYACRDNSTLRKHQNNHMGLVKLFDCTICKRSFKHKWMLKSHISESHLQMDLKKHGCDECGKMFRSKTHVSVHIRQVHDRVYATKCPVCGVKVSNRYNLRFHLATHVDYRPYTCTFSGCNKGFKDRGTLKKHTMIHRPELHYPCKQCDMKFSRKYRLVKHMTQHEDRKKCVICDYCHHSFYSKNYLIKHIQQKHTNRQIYICDKCGIKTINKPGMILHWKYGHESHENDKECKICHTKYKRHEYLKSHYYRSHSVRYKMAKPYGKRRPKPEKDLKAEVKVKMEPVDEDFDKIDLLDIDKEEIQEDCLQYSQSVLNEDIQACVLGTKGNTEEIEFDQFLVTHMFRKTKDEHKNLPEDVDPIIMQKTNETIDELLRKCEKNKSKRERKRYDNKIKAFAKQKKMKAKMDAKMLEEKKKEEEEKRRRDEIYSARRVEEEIVELEKLRVQYNERMENISLNEYKNKERTKIKYFKAKTNEISKVNIDLSDEDNDDISFAVKPSRNYMKCSENNEITNKNGNNNDFDEVNDESGENNSKVDEHSNGNSKLNDINDENDKSGEKNSKCVGNNDDNNEFNDTNDELAQDNTDVGKNTKTAKVIDNDGKTNRDNSEEIKKIVELNDHNIQIKERNKEIIAEKNEIIKENNEELKTISSKNDLNEENDGENRDNDELNDKVNGNNNIRKSNRMRKPNKLYQQEVNKSKHSKINFKTHQCYVCFKLYPTKEELIQHCQIHFDVCSLKTLTKCPICDFVTPKSLSAHLLKKHDVHLKIPFNHIKERNINDGSKYCYNADGRIIEVIPSVKILNKKASIEIDKRNRENKDKSITKTKLIRKGKEWIVEKEDLNLKFDLLPEFDEKEYKKLKISDNYIDRMKQIYKLAKKRGLKMAFPCFDCDKICQNLSALKLHNRKHQVNPKPFRPRGEVKREKERYKNRKVITNLKNRNAKPKPIENRHKCDDELKKFYETNIRGGDIEFWQFLKIFNKMNRENITDFDELEERTDFGIHTPVNTQNLQKNNKPKSTNTLKNAKIDKTGSKNAVNNKTTTKSIVKIAKTNVTAAKNIPKPAINIEVNTKNLKNGNKNAKPTYKRVIMISKEDYKKRIEAKNRLREKNLLQDVKCFFFY